MREYEAGVARGKGAREAKEDARMVKEEERRGGGERGKTAAGWRVMAVTG